MGEEIFNFVLSDLGGIPALPVFIGNYLLDLLSSFFPIFLILSSFVMIYIGFTRGSGDWKQTGQQIAPTAVSIAVILGLLSMKTPYSSEDGGNISGQFWKETNSYTVVELMNTFLGFGNIFADALTHKIIYGSIDVDNNWDNDMDGYFPAVLQAMVDGDKNKEVKEFLTNTIGDDRGNSISDIIEKNNNETAIEVINLTKDLQSLGVLADYRKIKGRQVPGDDISAYSNLNNKRYFELALTTNDQAKIHIHNIAKNNAAQNTTQMSEYNQLALVTYKQNTDTKDIERVKLAFDPDKYFEAKGVKIEDENSVKVNIPLILNTYSGKPGTIEGAFNYMQYKNFSQEERMLGIVNGMAKKYVGLYKVYDAKINDLKSKLNNSKNDSEAKAYKTAIKAFEERRAAVLGQVVKITEFGDDLNYLIHRLSGSNSALSKNHLDSLASIIPDIAKNGVQRGKFIDSFLADDLLEKYLQHENNISEDDFHFHLNGNKRIYSDRIGDKLNSIMRDKAFITNVVFDKFKGLLEEDAYEQTAMGSRSLAPYTKAFLDKNKIKSLNEMEKRLSKVRSDYANDTGKTVAQRLKDDIANNKVSVDSGISRGEIIHWTDLGKYYATFKNIYSPMVTNIITMQSVNGMEQEKMATLVGFMSDLEPTAKTERLIGATSLYATLSGGSAIIKAGANTFTGQSALKGVGGGLWEAIKTIGGMYFAIFFVNVVLPAFVWMFVIITYYVEMSIYVAVFPIGFMFMIFQSYRQSLHQYINMLLGFILMPIVLVSIYFIVLYIDMLLPMFFKQFLPFFASGHEISDAFSLAFGSTNNMLTDVTSATVKTGMDFINEVGSTISGDSKFDIMEVIGNFIYTLLSLLMSTLLLFTFFRANEYMSKILNVSTVGMDSFQGRETVHKFGAFDKTGMTGSLSGR